MEEHRGENNRSMLLPGRALKSYVAVKYERSAGRARRDWLLRGHTVAWRGVAWPLLGNMILGGSVSIPIVFNIVLFNGQYVHASGDNLW